MYPSNLYKPETQLPSAGGMNLFQNTGNQHSAETTFVPLQAVTDRYKTIMCKHFESNGICPLGVRCHFAHGHREIRSIYDPIPKTALEQNNRYFQLKSNPTTHYSNYKTMKCKNFSSTGSCKYGTNCTFAHGDEELRKPTDPFSLPMGGPGTLPNLPLNPYTSQNGKAPLAPYSLYAGNTGAQIPDQMAPSMLHPLHSMPPPPAGGQNGQMPPMAAITGPGSLGMMNAYVQQPQSTHLPMFPQMLGNPQPIAQALLPPPRMHPSDPYTLHNALPTPPLLSPLQTSEHLHSQTLSQTQAQTDIQAHIQAQMQAQIQSQIQSQIQQTQTQDETVGDGGGIRNPGALTEESFVENSKIGFPSESGGATDVTNIPPPPTTNYYQPVFVPIPVPVPTSPNLLPNAHTPHVLPPLPPSFVSDFPPLIQGELTQQLLQASDYLKQMDDENAKKIIDQLVNNSQQPLQKVLLQQHLAQIQQQRLQQQQYIMSQEAKNAANPNLDK